MEALDVEIHHLETPHQLQFTDIKVVASGPLRAALSARVKYGSSVIDVIVSCLYCPASLVHRSVYQISLDATPGKLSLF
jgi:alpha-mannosidase